jgi:hypothetical protein
MSTEEKKHTRVTVTHHKTYLLKLLQMFFLHRTSRKNMITVIRKAGKSEKGHPVAKKGKKIM